MQRWAVILAVEEYNSYGGTPFCHNDANLIRDTLVKHCDYSEKNVFLDLLTPFQATSPSQIIDNVKEKVNGSTAGDTVLFFYAGHGSVYNNEPYLILPQTQPTDFVHTALPLRSISDALRAKVS